MFEQEDGVDPFIFYGSNGADVNAFTSFTILHIYFMDLIILKKIYLIY